MIVATGFPSDVWRVADEAAETKPNQTPLLLTASQLTSFDILQQMRVSSEGAGFVRVVGEQQLNAVLPLSDVGSATFTGRPAFRPTDTVRHLPRSFSTANPNDLDVQLR